MVEAAYKVMSLRSFQRVWQELCPQITISKPKTDLCHKCQTLAISTSSCGQDEDEKAKLLEEYTDHVLKAKAQREYYRNQCAQSKNVFLELTDEEMAGGQPPCVLPDTLHYSWDFAQQVFFPHHAQQTGPIFFKTSRKCAVFGVCAEGSGQQVFYLLDEPEMPGKGADTVVSLVHHYFHYHGLGEENAEIHFDNCAGQNKNHTVFWYALWRTMTGLHKRIELSTMIAGHTKFHPDWHFGLWKSRWRKSNAETIGEVYATVTSSLRSGHNIPQLVGDPEKPVEFFYWKLYLQQFFKQMKNISKYHHLLLEANRRGLVQCREFAASDVVEFALLKNNAVVIPGLPSKVCIKGMDVERQWYLHDTIREFCRIDIRT